MARLNVLVPHGAVTGGNRIMFEYAAALSAEGDDVAVYMPVLPYRFNRPLSSTPRLLAGHYHRRRDMASAHVGLAVPQLMRTPGRLRPADATLVSAWPIAEHAAKHLPPDGVTYLVQHLETDAGPLARVLRTYTRTGFRLVAGSSSTLGDLAQLGLHATLVLNGISAPLRTRRAGGRFDVLAAYSPAPHKGWADTRQALESAASFQPGLRVGVFGRSVPRDLPRDWVTIERPTDQELHTLYESSRALLYGSRKEGFGLPPFEAVAAGSIPVSTAVGEVSTFLRGTDLLAPPGDPLVLAYRLLAVLALDVDACDQVRLKLQRRLKSYSTAAAVHQLRDVMLRQHRDR